MRLTSKQYARGLLSWMPVEGLEMQIGTAENEGDPVTWSPPMRDPLGSPVEIDIGSVFQLRWNMSGHEPIVLAKMWTRLERVSKGVVITRYFHGLPKKAVVLRHVPDYGIYHRLVVDAGTLNWDEDVVFREMGILVRFVTGSVEGEQATGLKAVVTEEGKPALQGDQGTVTATGRFIEIVTPGPSAQQAELHAFATLGLLALALGQNVLGRVVFSEPWDASPKEQRGDVIATGTAFARKAEIAEVDFVDSLLDRLTRDGPTARARTISLRWYERGLRATEPLDMLLSFFIGVETLVAAYAKANAPIPVEIARKPENDEILEKIKTMGQKVMTRVSQRIRGASIRDQFDFYAQKHGLGAEATSRFDKAKRVRDNAVHGDEVDVTLEVGHEAEKLLRAMLKSDFDVTDELPWEKEPAVHGMRLTFTLVPADEVLSDAGAESVRNGGPTSPA